MGEKSTSKHTVHEQGSQGLEERKASATPAKRRGILICVSGPSGVGKGTIIDALRAKEPTLVHSVSVTTRAPRPGEEEGVHYYFRTHEEFEELLARGEILEHDRYVDNYYGTPRAPIERQLQEGLDVIMDVTVPGSLTTMEFFPEALTIFLLPPSLSELDLRLRGRGTETDDAIQSRLAKAVDEIHMASRFMYNVVNDDLDETVEVLRSIIRAERYRSSRCPHLADDILARSDKV